MGKKVLVTGATGSVGVRLALYLHENGYDVDGVSFKGPPENLAKLEAAGIRHFDKDLAGGDLDDLPDDYETIYHECVVWGHYAEDTTEDKNLVYHVNTFAVGRCMLRWPKARFVLGSTGGLYSHSAVALDETAPTVVIGTYHSGKFAMEQLAKFLGVQFNIPIVILRYYWPTGSFDDVARDTVKCVVDGTPVRDSIHDPWNYSPLDMRDVCRYTTEAVAEAAVPANLFNCGGIDIVSKKQLLEIAGDILGKEPVIADREPKTKRAIGDCRKLFARFGEPEYRLPEMVRQWAEKVKAEGPDLLSGSSAARGIDWDDKGSNRKK